MNLVLTEEETSALRRRERVENQPKADVFFSACPICGFFEWRSTRPEGSGETSVDIGERPCAKCEEMHFRHGELFDYLVFVMRGQRVLASMVERTPHVLPQDSTKGER